MPLLYEAVGNNLNQKVEDISISFESSDDKLSEHALSSGSNTMSRASSPQRFDSQTSSKESGGRGCEVLWQSRLAERVRSTTQLQLEERHKSK